MNVSIAFIYKRTSEKLYAYIESKLLECSIEFNFIACKNYINDIQCDKEIEKFNCLCTKNGENLKNIFNEIYEYHKHNVIDSVIIPLEKWQHLKQIEYSNIQLTDKNILFFIEFVPEEDICEFVSFTKDLFKYRNIHVSVKKSFACEKIYNLHFLDEENLIDVLKLRMNNRRKYIGWKYHANELRQKIKFHKDLIKFCIYAKLSKKYNLTYSGDKDIPKVIHYCWFGGKEIPEAVKKFVINWKEKLPDYDIKLWNEENFPISQYPFAKEAFEKKKWAFIADVARLHALYYEGGIYLDTDVEVLKSFDCFLKETVFAPYGPMNHICMSTIGARKHHPWIAQLLLWYDCVHCDADYTEIANAKIVTKLTRMLYGIKTDGNHSYFGKGVHVYPQEYFLPKQLKNSYLVTDKTHCIHHFSGLW